MLSTGEPYRLIPDVEIGLYRIMQEALQNVSVHSNAGQAVVAVNFAPDLLTLTISDDGQGFDPASVEQNGNGHFGLLGMRERAESFGGKLVIQAQSGRGTRIEVWVPLP
jgi:two-component system sensor histidine kinase DegS